MSRLVIHLFGKLQIKRDNLPLEHAISRKVQELFCYLLLNAKKPHARETLAGILWSDNATFQAKRSLRQALWQLQTAIDRPYLPENQRILLVEPNWIQVNPHADLWADTMAFEQIFEQIQGIPGEHLDNRLVHELRGAIDSYQGELLEGWYEDWCLYERERFQMMYLIMLDKLTLFCEAHHLYEDGILYCLKSLRYDRARERTHQQLMRFYYCAGDRASALHQYERCTAALDEELGVKPSLHTTQLYELIQADHLAPAPLIHEHGPSPQTLLQVLQHLADLKAALSNAQNQIQQDIRLIEQAIQRRADSCAEDADIDTGLL